MGEEIQIVGLSKAFTVRHNKADSLKSKFVGLFHKRYREQRETFWALRDITFNVLPGEAFGLIGRNGSGKSTLLKILAGVYSPTHGKIRLPANIRIGAMIELGVGFHPDLTGKENVFLGASIHGLNRKQIEEIYASILDFSELGGFMDAPLKNYSSGMYARLGFALAVNLKPDLLLVDEILSVGDEAFQRKCIDKMENFRAEGKTIVFVSHNPELVTRFCDRACVLDHGRLAFLGKSAGAVEAYHEMLAKG